MINKSIADEFLTETPQKYQSKLDKKDLTSSSGTSSSSEEELPNAPVRRFIPEVLHKEITDQNCKTFKKVSEGNATGKLINSIFKMFHRDRFIQKTRYRGNLLSLFYLPELLKPTEDEIRIVQLNNRLGGFTAEEPILCIGPDWMYSVLTFVAVNITISTVISVQPVRFKYGIMFGLNIFAHILWNVFFLITCLWNPGIAPRNPEIHEGSYLATIA